MTDTTAIASPERPPPLLDEQQLNQILTQGHIQAALKPELLDVCSELSRATKLFFEKSVQEKEHDFPQDYGTELGYYDVPGEKEYVTLRHAGNSASKSEQASERGEVLEARAAELWQQTAALMVRIMYQISMHLKLPFEAWEPVLDGCLTLPSRKEDMTPTLLRMFRYLPATGIAEEHRDLGLLTLCVGTGKGLQVWDGDAKTGRWIDAEGPTILTGRTLTYLSSGKVPAALHRVVGNPEGRTSIVFALRPSTRKRVPMVPFGGWGYLEGGEIWAMVKDGIRNINATKDVQDKQRADQQHRAAEQKRIEEENRARESAPQPNGQESANDPKLWDRIKRRLSNQDGSQNHQQKQMSGSHNVLQAI